jgi:hypothetical protein
MDTVGMLPECEQRSITTEYVSRWLPYAEKLFLLYSVLHREEIFESAVATFNVAQQGFPLVHRQRVCHSLQFELQVIVRPEHRVACSICSWITSFLSKGNQHQYHRVA